MKYLILLIIALLFVQTYARCEETCRRTRGNCERNCRNRQCRLRCSRAFRDCLEECDDSVKVVKVEEVKIIQPARCEEGCRRTRGNCERNCRDRQCRIRCSRAFRNCLEECDDDDSVKKTEEPTCPEKVGEIRKKFRALPSREERRKFLQTLVKRLSEKYPDVEERQVRFFVRALFSPANPQRVCALYRRIFLGDVKIEKEEPACPEKVEEIRKKFRALPSREERRAFLQKLVKQLSEKYPDVEERQVRFFVRALFSPANPRRVCALYRRIFLGDAETNERTCDKYVAGLRKGHREADNKKEYRNKIRTGLTDKYPDVGKTQVNIFMGVLFSQAPARRVCALYKRFFLGDAGLVKEPKRCEETCRRTRGNCERNCRNRQCRLRCSRAFRDCLEECDDDDSVKKTEEPACPEKVKEIREKFSEMNREQRREFVGKVRARLSEKYPDVEERQVRFFIRALFSEANPRRVCALYRRIFLGDVVKTKGDDKPKCPVVVGKIREKWNELETRDDKKAFVKKIFNKIVERHPDVAKPRVFVFIRALLSELPARAVCKLRRRIFGPQEVVADKTF